MASISKDRGKWRAQVYRGGVRRSKTFRSKADAKTWAAAEELRLESGDVDSSITLGEVFDRYAREVSDKKRGAHWEIVRLNLLSRDKLAKVRMRDLKNTDLSDWRDRRLRDVAPASVLREKQLISAVLTTARRDWGLISHNPVQQVQWPSKPRPRSRVPTPAEIEAIRAIAGGVDTMTGRTFVAFLFACETAMRLGEVARIERDHIKGRVVHVPLTKNGEPRDVPLSTEALRLLDTLPGGVFNVSAASMSTLWRKLCKRAKVKDLRFHDSRRFAASKMAKVLSPMQLAKVTGHKDLNLLLNVYYKEDIEGIADLLG